MIKVDLEERKNIKKRRKRISTGLLVGLIALAINIITDGPFARSFHFFLEIHHEYTS
jgi:hypothetical protein